MAKARVRSGAEAAAAASARAELALRRCGLLRAYEGCRRREVNYFIVWIFQCGKRPASPFFTRGY